MRATVYQERTVPLLPVVASPQEQVEEEEDMDSTRIGSPIDRPELREAVAKVLGVDPESLRPR